MRELLEKAHQEDEKDILFEEDPEDAEFEAPAEVRDVYLEEFADTDEDIEDEEAEERQLRREERKKAKAKAGFDPLQPKTVRMGQASVQMPSAEELAILGPNVDVSKMAPSTLILEIRRRKREAKREQRSETRRSNLRASTLKTEADVIERERQEKIEKQNSRKGRKAQHVTGEIRGARPMTQSELIAAALEEEERNKEALTDWLKKEEERRELRRVGRKRVRGPRWTWVSRTVGRLVEVVDEEGTAGPAATSRDSTVPPGAGGGRGETIPREEGPSPVASTDTPATEEKKEAKAFSVGPPPAEGPSQNTEPPPAGAPSENTDDPLQQPASVETPTTVHGPGTPGPAVPPSTTMVPNVGVTTNPTAAAESVVTASEPPPEADTAKEPTKQATELPSADPPSTSKVDTSATPKNDDVTATPKNDDVPQARSNISEKGSETPTTVTETLGNSSAPQASTTDNVAASTPAVGGSTDGHKQGEKDHEAATGPYTRNYLILSQVPGGLPAELKLILGDHVDWSDVKVVPARNRPISESPI